ncbi:MAG: universal stress protein [Alphaproteobacteria bacterium]|jgi:nucleotide-binding universal stress UspA family protein|nr:universal stress protein [Alphaproteobacteria bacterium]MBM3733684.1 universal stress protein [Acidimicrobiia bacterium]MBM3950527.1 universal stress protein [Rhodospirillales bacterium]
MHTILIPIDGSPASLRAVDAVIDRVQKGQKTRIHLINVQPALPQAVTDFVGKRSVRDFHKELGEKELKKACAKLNKANIAHGIEIAVGDVAETIAAYATKLKCDEIVMGTRGHSQIANLLLGSSTTKLLHLAKVPVTLVK